MLFIDLAVKKVGSNSYVTPKLMSFQYTKIGSPLQNDSSTSGTTNTKFSYEGIHPQTEYVVAEGFKQISTLLDPSTTTNLYPSDKTTGITAGTTQTQVGATALTTYLNIVGTCANANDGVKLPSASADLCCVVVNNGAAVCKVWPATGDAVGTGAVNAADSSTIAVGEKVHYWAKDATTWYRVTPITK